MKHEDLPERWKLKIIEHLRANGEEKRERLSVYQFSPRQTVEIKFEDDSFAEFRFAFIIDAPEFNEVGVFTEHCGYHIFNSAAVSIDIVKW